MSRSLIVNGEPVGDKARELAEWQKSFQPEIPEHLRYAVRYHPVMGMPAVKMSVVFTAQDKQEIREWMQWRNEQLEATKPEWAKAAEESEYEDLQDMYTRTRLS